MGSPLFPDLFGFFSLFSEIYLVSFSVFYWPLLISIKSIHMKLIIFTILPADRLQFKIRNIPQFLKWQFFFCCLFSWMVLNWISLSFELIVKLKHRYLKIQSVPEEAVQLSNLSHVSANFDDFNWTIYYTRVLGISYLWLLCMWHTSSVGSSNTSPMRTESYTSGKVRLTSEPELCSSQLSNCSHWISWVLRGEAQTVQQEHYYLFKAP